MVDAAQGILVIVWIDGKSVGFLLGGGDEDEIVEEGDYTDEELQQEVEDQDPLSEYKVTKGTVCASRCSKVYTDICRR